MKYTYPAGPRINFPLAVVGQLLSLPFDGLEFAVKISREFGDIAHYKFGPLHIYQLNHPDLVRRILVEQPEKFYKPKLIKLAFRPFAGEGLFTSDGALWKQQRRLMQPAFHHRHLAVYGDVMVEHATRLADSWAAGQIREMVGEMTGLTLGIVVKTLFGGDLQEVEAIGRQMLEMLHATNRRLNSAFQIPTWVPTPGNLRERRAVARVDEITRVLIQARRAEPEKRDDLLSLLLAAVDEESGARMSDQQLRDEMMTLFLAGHETTAGALTWTWYLLSRHPEVEARLIDELRTVLAGRAPTAADLPKLPYAEMVIRESMRLYPPAPGFAREPVEDVEIGGYVVPKGSLIIVNTFALHRDPRFFPDPERYGPERFGPGWEERIPRFAYLPFGGGPRVCIGNGFAMMEARLILATIAQRFKLSMTNDAAIKPVQIVTVRPSGPVRMQIEKRAAI